MAVSYEDYSDDVRYYKPMLPVTAFVIEILQDNDIHYEFTYNGAMLVCGNNKDILMDDRSGISFYKICGIPPKDHICAVSQASLEYDHAAYREEIEGAIIAAIKYLSSD